MATWPPSASYTQNKGQYDFDSITTNSPYFLLLVLPYPTHLFIGSNTNVSTTDVLLTFCCHASSGQLEVALKCMVNLPTYKKAKPPGKLRPSDEHVQRASIEDTAATNWTTARAQTRDPPSRIAIRTKPGAHQATQCR